MRATLAVLVAGACLVLWGFGGDIEHTEKHQAGYDDGHNDAAYDVLPKVPKKFARDSL